MVGNKHKNGIICTFPGCEKAMRTQKFKLHFTKAHLKQGEAYSVEHRRRFEVAREDGAASASNGANGANGAANGSSDEPKGEPRVEAEQAQELAQEMRADVAWALKQQAHAQQQFEQQLRAAHEAAPVAAVGVKRPAVALEEQVADVQASIAAASAAAAAAGAADPANALLVDFVALMDRRFHELASKMGEMIEVQKELIDALKGSVGHQAPALALATAAEAVMKRRKKTGSLTTNGAGSAVV